MSSEARNSCKVFRRTCAASTACTSSISYSGGPRGNLTKFWRRSETSETCARCKMRVSSDFVIDCLAPTSDDRQKNVDVRPRNFFRLQYAPFCWARAGRVKATFSAIYSATTAGSIIRVFLWSARRSSSPATLCYVIVSVAGSQRRKFESVFDRTAWYSRVRERPPSFASSTRVSRPYHIPRT